MDPVSQGALGAAAAAAVAAPERLRWALPLGALAGMAPDLDVLIRSDTDPLLFLEYHRQFTHSLLFMPVGALLCALAFLPLTRGRIETSQSYLYCLLGYASHAPLDACTSYGAQLLWPFSDLRVAWNLIAVVDPLFTLALGLAIGAALLRHRRAFVRWGLCFALAYLVVGGAQRLRAERAALDLAQARGHSPERIEAKPSFGNLLLWKSWYVSEGRIFVDAIRLGTTALPYPGEEVALLDRDRDLPWLESASQQARDLERFRWFSAGMIALHPRDAQRVIDVRYSLVPNRIEPLWGIALDPSADPAKHARFFTRRTPADEERRAMAAMLRGSPSQPGAAAAAP